MKAIVYDKKGSPEKLIYRDVEKPTPNDNEVLIRILVVSANAADYRSIKMGIIPKNNILGSAIAGRVESAGKNIQQFKTGDNVIGDLTDFGFGGFAEYTVAPEKALAHIPNTITFEKAATIPVAATTALRACYKAKIKKDQNVLILGGGGGVGTFAIQLVKHFGAEVTAVCSSRNVEQCLSLGADYVIDYTKEDFTKKNKKYDVILAINGNYPLLACKRKLNKHGRYIVLGGSLSQLFKSLLFGWILSIGSKEILTLAAKSNAQDMDFMVNLVGKGIIKPIIENKFSFQNTPEAVRYLSEGHAKGKVVINVE